MCHRLEPVYPWSARVVGVGGDASGGVGVAGLQSAAVVGKALGAAACHPMGEDFAQTVVGKFLVTAIGIIFASDAIVGIARVSCNLWRIVRAALSRVAGEIVRLVLVGKRLLDKGIVRVSYFENSPRGIASLVCGGSPVRIDHRSDVTH